jgi:glycerophosphoryl diester phosphodiesterase
MKTTSAALYRMAVFAAISPFGSLAHAEDEDKDREGNQGGHRMHDQSVQLGPRPFYLVEGMDEGTLKDKLMSCENGPFYRTDFSIAHRGGALQSGT